MNWEILQSVVRSLLLSAGGSLVSAGLITADELNSGVGAICVVIGIVWSIINKVQAGKKLAAAKTEKGV